MKKLLLTLILCLLSHVALADRTPPGLMVGDSLAVSGGVHASAGAVTKTSDFVLSSVVGQLGYAVHEYYSDRLAPDAFQLFVNNGEPVTNSRTISMELVVNDDLSGFKEAEVKEIKGSNTQVGTLSDQLSTWTLGGATDLGDGDYNFEFTFIDRVGNKSSVPSTTSVRLDRKPPHVGTVVINGNALYTSSQVVTIQLASSDDSTGVPFVRLTNTPTVPGSWIIYPFIDPVMSINWLLEDTAPGEKAVYAQFRDGAGNWSLGEASDTIVFGSFSPEGNFSFVEGPTLICQSTRCETSRLDVPLKIEWDPAKALDLSVVQITGGAAPLTIQTNTSPLLTSYRLGDVDGLKTVSVQFIDKQGNRSSRLEKQIHLNQKAPPTPVVSVDVFTSSASLHITGDGVVSDIKFFDVVPGIGLDELGASSATLPVSYATQTVVFNDEDLKPNTRYGYEVWARDTFSRSVKPAQAGPFYTEAEVPTVTSLPEAKEVSVIRVTWGTGNNPLDTAYLLEWSESSSFSQVNNNGWMARVPIDVQGLKSGTAYYFRVRSRNHDGIESHVPVVLGSTRTLQFEQPQPPLLLEAVDVKAHEILWRWTRQPSTEEGFILQNATGGIVAVIPLVSSTQTLVHRETGLMANTTYTRSIVSFNHFKNRFTRSASSKGVAVVTPPVPPKLSRLIVHGSHVTAHWQSGGDPESTHYRMELAEDEGFKKRVSNSDWAKELSATLSGLRPRQTYFVRGFARGAFGASAPAFFGVVRPRTFDHLQDVSLTGPNARWRVDVPQETLHHDFEVSLETDLNRFQSVRAEEINQATEKIKAESSGLTFPFPDGVVEISMRDTHGNLFTPSLNNKAVLTHRYATQALAVLPKNLQLYYFHPRSKSWFRLPNKTLDVEKEEVSSALSSVGVFAAMATPNLDLNAMVVYPNPFRPFGPRAGSGPGQTGTLADGVTFANIPQQGRVRIYDLLGRLVKEISFRGNVSERWNVRNTAGQPVVSGVYLWVAESGDNRRTGQLVVIK